MKTLRFLGMTLLMVMLAVNFTACSDGEDEPNSPLVGTWVGGEVGFDFEETLTFNNNGTGQWDEDSFNYTTNFNKVVIDYGDGDPEIWTYSISTNTLNMTAEDGVEYCFIKK
ncbi:MAG TPA: hypothetical protein K8W07_05350 [Bacteroides togonis]|nr:hypothetical protein [Bacteroides togonis]